MARRASARNHPALWVAALIVALVALGGGFFLFIAVSDPFRTLQPLPLADYLDDAASLRGNTYKLEGTIENSLGTHDTHGRLYSLAVSQDNAQEWLPILVPIAHNQVNFQKGQRFVFKVQIRENGVIYAVDLSKK